MSQSVERLIKKNVIDRYNWNEEKGKSLVNDFLQLSQVAEELKSRNERAYTMFLQLIKEREELKKECKDRGKRIAKLQRKNPIASKKG